MVLKLPRLYFLQHRYFSVTSKLYDHESWTGSKRNSDFVKPFNSLDCNFKSCKETYVSKTTPQLIRAIFVFKLCSFQWLVNHQKQILKLARSVFGRRIFEKMMRMTFYGQFVAGSDQNDIRPTIERNWKFNVKSILDYAVEADLTESQAAEMESISCTPQAQSSEVTGERRYRAQRGFGDRREHVVSSRTFFYEDEAQCDANMWHFMKCIDAVSGTTHGTGFAAIKLTALGRPQFLLQLSELLFRLNKTFAETSDLPIVDCELSKPVVHRPKDLLEWSNLVTLKQYDQLFRIVHPSGDGATIQRLLPPFTDSEEGQLKNMLLRLDRLAQHASLMDVRLMIDAEQSYFQPAISRLAIELMRKYNREKSLIFNTYQTYLKDALNLLRADMELSEKEGFYFGAKIVRGAYMDQERRRAQEVGYADPINDTYEATNTMMQRCVNEAMRRIKRREKGHAAVMIASHNEDTVRFAVNQMREFGISPFDRVICFGQLLGMCDQVSFSLGQAGFSVYKYVPYGPVEDVIPYLSRRAQENGGMLQKVLKERQLIWTELQRRRRAGEIQHNPMSPSVLGIN